jgi:hypothetical protein
MIHELGDRANPVVIAGNENGTIEVGVRKEASDRIFRSANGRAVRQQDDSTRSRCDVAGWCEEMGRYIVCAERADHAERRDARPEHDRWRMS